MQIWRHAKKLEIYTENADFEGVYKIEVKADILPKFFTVVTGEKPTMTIDLEIIAPVVDVGFRDEKLGLVDKAILVGEEFFYSVGNQLIKCHLGAYRQVYVQLSADFLVWNSDTKIITIEKGLTVKEDVGEYEIRVTQTCSNSTYIDTLID